MNQSVRLIHECPNIENTIPYTIYQSSSPKLNFLEEDKFVIYGGGNNYSISLDSNIPDLDYSSVSLFILNCSLIVWFNKNSIGLEITYPSIIFHGHNDDLLYLNMEDNDLIGNYITIKSNAENIGSANPLFNNFGSTLKDIYIAISTVSDMYANAEAEEEGEENNMIDTCDDLPRLDISQVALLNPEEFTPKAIHNTGQADDLDDDNMDDINTDEETTTVDSKYGAGMHVDVGYASIAGTKTRRESDGFLEERGTVTHRAKRNRLG